MPNDWKDHKTTPFDDDDEETEGLLAFGLAVVFVVVVALAAVMVPVFVTLH